MPTDPLTGTPYPDLNHNADIAQIMKDAVPGLAENTIAGAFSSTTTRDSAYTSWQALGYTMRDGLHCWVNGIGVMVYTNGAWGTAAARGVVSAGEQSTPQSSSSSTEARVLGAVNRTVNLLPGRVYRVRWSGGVSTDTLPSTISVNVRGARNAAPVTGSTRIAGGNYPFSGTGGPGAGLLEFSDLFTVIAADSYTLAPFIARPSGSGTVSITGGPSHLEIEDVGCSVDLSGVVQLS